MCQKRYDIIRVDKHCPNWYQKDIDQKFLCDNQNCISCDGCRYGDTKEQLVNKITTAIEIAINKYERGEIISSNKNKALAEIIVEFLGIKDD